MSRVILKSLTRTAARGAAPKVRDLSLECADHGFTVLFGLSGAGKSAILRLVAGLDQPESGEIFVGDRAVLGLRPHQRNLAFASPEAPLLPHLTISANLALPLQLRRTSKEVIARRTKETAALLGLESLLNRKPPTLHLQDLRRSELARALVQQPKALLLDNPLAGLESGARAHLRADLARLHHQLRATIVYSTDDPAEAMTLASHLVLLRHGVIEQQGPPLEIYREPASVFAAAALGSPGMNFLRGSLKSADGQLTFKESDGGVVELKLGDRPAAQPFVGRDVLLGIRPEDCIAVPADQANGPTIFQTLVDFVEIRGGEALFHAQTGAHAFISRSRTLVDPREAGRRGRFRLDAARAHLFDPGTTQRIA
ncbi:MAG: ABC transporter ATP-binding protein [Terrimicrobiaceae bacterium]|nr:ABC transporter ATP-binding protein [Terrimicrobiaceae bacterium]